MARRKVTPTTPAPTKPVGPPPGPTFGPPEPPPDQAPPDLPAPPGPTAAPPSPPPPAKEKPASKAQPERLKVAAVETDIAPDLSHASLKIIFSDGNFGPFDIYKLKSKVQVRAAAFGIEQKIRKARDPVAVGRAIAQGTWPEGRVKGVSARIPLIVRAIARLTGMDETDAYDRWKTLPDEGPDSKKAFRGDQRVKGAIAQIKAETEQAGVDVDAVFRGAG